MVVSSVLVWVTLIFFVGIFVGMLVLQWYFSKRENQYWGFILPALCFFSSLLEMIFVQAGFGRFLVANVSTAILLAMYIVAREGKKKQRELEEMKIRDL